MKKNVMTILLLTVCLFLLAGCSAIEETTVETVAESATETTVETTATAETTAENVDKTTVEANKLTVSPTFSEALVQNGFGLSSSDVETCLDTWTYHGKALSSYAEVMCGDSYFGGTTIYYAEGIYSWTIDYQENVDSSLADCTNSFYFTKPIDGVVMPYGIGFDNTLAELLHLLDVQADLSSDQEQVLEHVLIPDYESKLVLTTQNTLSFAEYYESVYPQSDGSGLHVLVTRSVILRFDSETNKLNSLIFKIEERRVYNEEALLDPQTFSHALDRNGFLPEVADYNFWNLLTYCSCEGEILARYIVGRVSNDDEDNDDYSTHIQSNAYFDGNSTHRSASDAYNEKDDVYLTFYCPIEGLTMPYGVGFGDRLENVLEVLSCSVNPWVAGENAWTMTLSQEKEEGRESTLVLVDHSRFPDSNTDDLALVFTEVFQTTHKDGRIFDVTRSVRLDFGVETGMYAITFSITEEAPWP